MLVLVAPVTISQGLPLPSQQTSYPAFRARLNFQRPCVTLTVSSTITVDLVLPLCRLAYCRIDWQYSQLVFNQVSITW